MATHHRSGDRENSTRRESLRLIGLVGLAAVTGCGSSGATSGTPPRTSGTGAGGAGNTGGTGSDGAVGPDGVGDVSGAGKPPSCTLRPAQTEGPYFLDDTLNRTDIRSNPSDGAVMPGAPLRLAFHVGGVTGTSCAPLAGAIVDIWQCDAAGVYSGFRDFGGLFDTTGKKFLRGFQSTGSDGTCQFLTIYPGWYPGRSVHIHFKIRATHAGRALELTSQLYFPDALSDQVFARAPYSSHTGPRTLNSADGIFGRVGSDLLLAPTSEGEGYTATFDVGLQLG